MRLPRLQSIASCVAYVAAVCVTLALMGVLHV
jgi:hypothetical protein